MVIHKLSSRKSKYELGIPVRSRPGIIMDMLGALESRECDLTSLWAQEIDHRQANTATPLGLLKLIIYGKPEIEGELEDLVESFRHADEGLEDAPTSMPRYTLSFQVSGRGRKSLKDIITICANEQATISFLEVKSPLGWLESASNPTPWKARFELQFVSDSAGRNTWYPILELSSKYQNLKFQSIPDKDGIPSLLDLGNPHANPIRLGWHRFEYAGASSAEQLAADAGVPYY